jgi:hypothetical protein
LSNQGCSDLNSELQIVRVAAKNIPGQIEGPGGPTNIYPWIHPHTLAAQTDKFTAVPPDGSSHDLISPPTTTGHAGEDSKVVLITLTYTRILRASPVVWHYSLGKS